MQEKTLRNRTSSTGICNSWLSKVKTCASVHVCHIWKLSFESDFWKKTLRCVIGTAYVRTSELWQLGAVAVFCIWGRLCAHRLASGETNCDRAASASTQQTVMMLSSAQLPQHVTIDASNRSMSNSAQPNGSLGNQTIDYVNTAQKHRRKGNELQFSFSHLLSCYHGVLCDRKYQT